MAKSIRHSLGVRATAQAEMILLLQLFSYST